MVLHFFVIIRVNNLSKHQSRSKEHSFLIAKRLSIDLMALNVTRQGKGEKIICAFFNFQFYFGIIVQCLLSGSH